MPTHSLVWPQVSVDEKPEREESDDEKEQGMVPFERHNDTHVFDRKNGQYKLIDELGR